MENDIESLIKIFNRLESKLDALYSLADDVSDLRDELSRYKYLGFGFNSAGMVYITLSNGKSLWIESERIKCKKCKGKGVCYSEELID
jgi:hypothetical protein